jgi:hypothetical protein
VVPIGAEGVSVRLVLLAEKEAEKKVAMMMEKK